jgi:tetratricopeptide (TPR) repeat protein
VNRAALFLAIGVFCSSPALGVDGWTLAQNGHFEVFSQTNDQTAAQALLWFEQLRGFFQQEGLPIPAFRDQNKPPLRVIGFHSESDYAAYRLRPLASAYYASDGDRDYIVMASLRTNLLSVAAHEYSHYVLRASGMKLPAWLQEGLGEVFSTLRMTQGGYLLGGDLPARLQTLEGDRKKLLPLPTLLAASDATVASGGRKEAEVFYAQSWALVDLLSASPKYAAHFRELIAEFNSGSQGGQPFQKVYGVSLVEVAKDLTSWMGSFHSPHLHPVVPTESPAAEMLELSRAHAQYLLAELALVSGHVDQARARFDDLAREQPTNPDVAVALGTIALRQGNRTEAIKLWRRAISLNVKDPELCYRYALLADESGKEPEAKLGLERAVTLAPGFDDARYRLALIEYHAAEYRPALENLRKMAVPKDVRRCYAYWTAMASSLLELNENDEARKIALEAAKVAQNDSDRQKALQLSYVAATDLNVQFSTDAAGHSQMVTTRIPHGATNWNPFIEPSDAIQHSNGKLSQVLCTNDKLTGFLLQTASGTVTLEVADPARVLMRNSPNEFYCGAVRAKTVEADYAVITLAGQTRNILRGMTFQP